MYEQIEELKCSKTVYVPFFCAVHFQFFEIVENILHPPPFRAGPGLLLSFFGLGLAVPSSFLGSASGLLLLLVFD